MRARAAALSHTLPTLGRRRAAGMLWLLVLLGGCATSPPAPAPKEDLLAFLEQAHVTRDEVNARLGPPSAVFEHDHVVTYRLAHSNAGYVVVARNRDKSELSWQGVDYDLVLAFEADGTLREHRLIAVRAAPPAR
jgi:hypothetical protein